MARSLFERLVNNFASPFRIAASRTKSIKRSARWRRARPGKEVFLSASPGRSRSSKGQEAFLLRALSLCSRPNYKLRGETRCIGQNTYTPTRQQPTLYFTTLLAPLRWWVGVKQRGIKSKMSMETFGTYIIESVCSATAKPLYKHFFTTTSANGHQVCTGSREDHIIFWGALRSSEY